MIGIIRLVAMDYRGGKNELFFVHAKAFWGSIAWLCDRKKAQCGQKRAFLTHENSITSGLS
jgi:hypothetical protein